MKKLVFGSAFLLLTIMFTVVSSCSKEETQITKIEKEQLSEKAGTCSCSISGFWGSCSVTCPIRYGVCLANCTRVQLAWGLLGSAVSCTCGTAGVSSSGGGGSWYVVPEGIYYDDVNLQNLKNVRSRLSGQVGFEDVYEKIDRLIIEIENQGNSLVRVSQDFFDSLHGLTQDQVNWLNSEIRYLVEACGRG